MYSFQQYARLNQGCPLEASLPNVINFFLRILGSKQEIYTHKNGERNRSTQTINSTMTI